MNIFSLVLALAVCAFAFAQQEQQQQQQQQQSEQRPAVLGSLDVPVRIEGKVFNVRFEPEKETAQSMAQQLCTQRGDMIGVTAENLDVCVQNVGAYLQNAVNRWVAEKTVNVPLTVKDKSFALSFIPERSDSLTIARRFCTEQGGALGVTAESLNGCVEPVATYVQRAVNSFFAEKTLQMPLTIEGKTYTVSFLPERHTPLNVALKLCRDNAAELGITTDAVLEVCAQNVGQTLSDASTAWAKSKTLTFPMSVNKETFTISFMPERETAANVARSFCVQRAEALGLTEQTLETNCVKPATEFVAQQVEKWVESKRLVVPVQVAGETVQLSLFPERESAVDVSRRFCVTNAAALKLTNETIVDSCIAPLNKIVGEAVNEWAKKATAAANAAAAAPAAAPAAPPAASA